MANLSITLNCNRTCTYCFAAELRPAFGETPYMSLDTYERTLDFLIASGIKEVRLLGGEPTTHPLLLDFLARAGARGLSAVIFTNGLWPAGLGDDIRATGCTCRFLVNIHQAEHYQDGEWARLHAVLASLGDAATLGYNIATPVPEMDFIAGLIDELRLAPRLRIGLAHPTLSGTNAFLRPKDYHRVGEYLMDYRARYPSLKLTFDCGVVPCMFPPDAFSQQDFHAGFSWGNCGCIPRYPARWLRHPLLPVGLLLAARGTSRPCRWRPYDGTLPRTPPR